MTETATILAYRVDYRSDSASEWYCPTCFAELEAPDSGAAHLRETPAPQPLSPELRESMIQYLINTQAIEGFTVPYNEAAAIVDEVYQEPLIDLG